MLLLCLGVLLNSAAGNGDQILNMTNNQIALRNLSIVAILLNILLNLMLIPTWGIEGAALSSFATTVLFNLATVILIRKKLGFYTFGR